MEIIKLSPATKDYIWGGTKLKTEYGISADTDILAEAWVLSCHKDGQSVCTGGTYDGLTLSEMIEKAGKGVLGKRGGDFDFFPILVKFIDAKSNLSVQVHPSDEYALKNEGQYGKTEMWYVMDADEGAFLYYGLNRDVSKEEFKIRLENGTIEEILNKVEAKRGDCFFIESGTIHAIGKGLLIAEIQQNSNLTYRLYDYGRVGKDGKPRELHIEKATQVSDMTRREIKKETKSGILASCKYFTAELFELNDTTDFTVTDESFANLIVLEGKIEIDGIKAEKGNSFFIPAGYGKVNICGKAKFIVSRV